MLNICLWTVSFIIERPDALKEGNMLLTESRFDALN